MKGKTVVKRMLSLALSASLIATMLPAQPMQAAQGKSAMPERLAYFSFEEEAQAGEDGKAWMDGEKAKGEVLGTAGNLSISTADKHSGAGALELKGSAWLQVVGKENAGDNLLAGKKDLTISYWSKSTGEPGWGWSASKDNQKNNNNENYIGILDKPNSVTVERYKGNRSKPSISTSDVKKDEWRLVTVVLGQEETVLYVNGERKNSQLDPWPLTDILTETSRLMIGRANWGDNGEYFQGLIDDFAVYDGALTAIQVKDILYLGKTEEDIFDEIELAPGEDLHIVEGKSKQLAIKDIENFANVSYSSDDTAIAIVDEATGLVTGVSAGETAITAKATLNGKTKEVKTKVKVGELSAFETSYPFDGSLGEGVLALKGNYSNFAAYDSSAITYEDGRKAGENLSDRAVKTGEFGIRLPQKNLGSDYTVSVWVNSLGNNVNNNSPVLSLGKGVGKTDNWPAIEESWIAIAGTGSKDADKNVLKVWANSHIAGDYSNTGGAKNIMDNFDMPKNAWNMLTVSQSGNRVSVYLNGKLIGSAKATAALRQNNADDRYIHLGLNYWDDEFVGLVDEAKVYTVALDAREVLVEYLKSATKEERRAYLGIPSEEALSFVKGDLTLPTEADGVSLSWKSSAPDVISEDGKLVAEVMDGSQATLTATVSSQGEKVLEESFPATLAVEIIKKYVDKNNAELKTEAVEELQKSGSAYAYVPEDNPEESVLIKDGKAYVRNEEESILSISSVGKDARIITVRYDEAEIVSVASPEETYYAVEGNAPVLPKTLKGATSANTTVDVPVEWAVGKLEAGENTVMGTAAGKAVSAKVYIYPCDEAVKGTNDAGETEAAHRVHKLSNTYKGVVVAEYEIETTGTVGDGAVIYADSTPEQDGIWNAGGAMLQFKNSVGYFVTRLGQGDGGPALDYPASADAEGVLKYDASKIYRVRVEMDSNAAPGKYQVFITDPDGKVYQITQPGGNGFRKYNEGLIQSYYVGRDGFKIKNHKISWVSGYATKKLEYYIGGSTEPKVIEDVTKVLPGKLSYADQVKDIYEEGGKIYVLNSDKTKWLDGKDTPAAGENAVYQVYYDEATINDQEIAVTTRPGVAPELPDKVEATFSNGLKQEVAVTWETDGITEDQYDAAGKTFSVMGAFANDPNAKLSAKVTVVSKESYLIAKYEFDGDNFLNDSTANGKNGTAQGTVTQVAGMKGSAAYLNRGAKGQSSIKLPDNLLAGKDGKIQDKLTVSMFMRPEVDGNAFAMTLHGSDTVNYIGLINKPTEFSITYRKSGKTDEQAKGAAGTERGKWVHVAFVADGANLKLYQDGKLVSSVPNTIKASDLAAQNNYIGYSMWEDSDDKGAFDEFEVYGAALTDAEIRAISDAGYRQQVEAVKGTIRAALAEANQTEGGAAFDTENIVGDIKLPTSLASSLEGLDIQVSWASSQESVVKANGEVTRPNQDTKVTLTPTVTAGSYSAALEGIQVTVKESESVNYKRIEELLSDAKAAYEGKQARQIYTEESLGLFQGEIAHAESEMNAVKEAEAGSTATPAQNKARIKAAADRLEESLAKFKAEETLELKSLADLNQSALAASYPLAKDAADAAGKAEAGVAAEKVTFSKKGYGGASFVGEESRKSVINLPTALFQKKDQLTVSFWAKDDGPNTDNGRNQAVFGIGANQDKYVLVNTNRENRLRAVITTQSYRDEQSYVESNDLQVAFPKGTWAHLTLVFDGTQFSVYRNGELLGSRDTGIRISDLGDLTVACIGNSVWGNQDKDYIGSVKDFRIFDASLAEEQVKAVYSDRRNLEAEEAAAELVEAIEAKAEGDAYVWNLEQGAFTVPITGNQGETIAWSSSDNGVINFADKTASAGKATVTASIRLNGVEKEIVFRCTVVGKDAKEELNRLVDEIQKQAESGNYVKHGMDIVLARAKELQASLSETAGEAEVRLAIAELNGLLEQNRISIVGLKAAIEAAEAIVPSLSGYLEDGQEEFKSALESAKADLAKAQGGTEVSKKEIADAEARLKEAQEALVLKEDRGALDALVKQAKEERQDDYTAASWKVFQDVLKNAEDVLKDPKSSKLALTAAEQALKGAMDGLVRKANAQELADLKADIASAEQLQAGSGNYTSSSWNDFEAALENAKKASQGDVKEEVLAAKASLQDAKSRLVDISDLKAAIEEAGSADQEAYTSATWAPFQEAWVKANITIAEGHAAKEDVEAAAKALRDAKAALERKADTRELARAIEEATALVQSDEYTYDSRDSLRKALAAAKEVISQEKSQKEVNAAVKLIEYAKTKLERPVDKTDLNARIDEMDAFITGGGSQYIGKTWDALVKALEEAKKAASGSASSQEVASALKGLDDAFAALKVRGDKTMLNRQIEEVTALDSAVYANWSALQSALDDAKSVQNDPDALQNDINAAVNALIEARGALKIVEYHVTIDAGNGAAAESVTVMAGHTVSEPPTPVKAGYAFVGWFVGDAAFDFGAPILADTAITAKWEEIVLPSVEGASVKVAKAVYNGKARKPEVTVKLNGKTLVQGIDFTVKYVNNVKVGQGTVTIQGMEGYTGSKSVKFNIAPAKVKSVKLANKKGRKAAVKFSKAAGAKGYQVTYSSSSSFKSAKSKKVTKNSLTLSGLKKNKTYYVKVRAYAKINGQIVYGAYSTKMKVKIKK